MVKINFELRNPSYYYISLTNYIENQIDKVLTKLRQQDKIKGLEKEVEKQKKEAEISLDVALREEREKRKILQEKLIVEAQLDKYCNGDSYIKKILPKSRKEIKILSESIPSEREKLPRVKISSKHPRSEEYLRFIKKLEGIKYITEIVDGEAREAKKSRIRRITEKEILFIHVDNNCRGYRISVKTTAENIRQQHHIVALIEEYFIRP
ncbi:MAG: hypothetical protein IB618_01635 [Candidatus Pacearchaeota archaeon]|nr:MAG: hypothetical protein IB618_01635 [Candidatus Pacearchaeota archaeon]